MIHHSAVDHPCFFSPLNSSSPKFGMTHVVTYSHNAPLAIPAPDRLSRDTMAMRQLVGSQHALPPSGAHSDQEDRDVDEAGRHACSQRATRQRCGSLADLTAQRASRIGILIQQTIDGCQRRWCRQTRLGEWWGKCNRDRLRCSPRCVRICATI